MNVTTQPNVAASTPQLVNAEGLLESLFPANARPTVRWLREQCRRRTIPFIKIGRLVWFDPEQVRQSLNHRHTVHQRK